MVVYILDHLLRARFLIALDFGGFGSCRIDGSLIVETVQIAARLLELLNPYFRLLRQSAADVLV